MIQQVNLYTDELRPRKEKLQARMALSILALALVLGRNRLRNVVAATGLVLMALIWIAGAVLVGALGATEETDEDATVILRHYHPDQPGR